MTKAHRLLCVEAMGFCDIGSGWQKKRWRYEIWGAMRPDTDSPAVSDLRRSKPTTIRNSFFANLHNTHISMTKECYYI